MKQIVVGVNSDVIEKQVEQLSNRVALLEGIVRDSAQILNQYGEEISYQLNERDPGDEAEKLWEKDAADLDALLDRIQKAGLMV